MVDDATEIRNLLYRYAELIDAGDFAALGALFADALLTAEGTPLELRGAEAITRYYERTTRRYPETGTPLTRHLVTNAIVEVDGAAGTAQARSCYTVLQRTERLPLQPIITGRYHDGFERSEGRWRFRSRHFFVDLVGELGEHLLFDLAEVPRA